MAITRFGRFHWPVLRTRDLSTDPGVVTSVGRHNNKLDNNQNNNCYDNHKLRFINFVHFIHCVRVFMNLFEAPPRLRRLLQRLPLLLLRRLRKRRLQRRQPQRKHRQAHVSTDNFTPTLLTAKSFTSVIKDISSKNFVTAEQSGIRQLISAISTGQLTAVTGNDLVPTNKVV